MASGNARIVRANDSESTSGNTEQVAEFMRAEYRTALERSTLAESTKDKYTRRVAAYLAWLNTTDIDGDPLAERDARNWAVRDYRLWLKGVKRARPSTINGALAAIDDFYTRRGLGPAEASREDATRRTAPKALDDREVRRYLRAVECDANARDAVVALTPYYAGTRVGELVGLDLEDVRMSARKGELRIVGKGSDGGKERRVPIHANLRSLMTTWIGERNNWAGSDGPALLLNRSGGRLSDRAARTVICSFGEAAGLGDDEPFGPHVLRHTFGYQLVRRGVDIVTTAELMGHSRLDTTRMYSLPTEADRAAALEVLTTDA